MSSHLIRLGILGVAITAVAPPLLAQARGALSGTITDSVSGAPIVGARVAVWCPDCSGRHPTDSAGHYRLDRIPEGNFRFEAYCPSVTGLGPEIALTTVSVAAGRETVVDLHVSPGQCSELPYSERRGVFRGYWTSGFESSAFVPCADSVLGVPAPLLPGKRMFPPKAWAYLAPNVRKQSISWPHDAPINPWGNSTVFVVWRGMLKGPGTYGHMGVSEFSMVVDSIITVRTRGPKNCRVR
jgi:hypothetical protein